ncbi:MAG: HNH endonuclease [Butyrivibrio sp.]|nr:HNH endonuclease [Butyrivibrio sp.]
MVAYIERVNKVNILPYTLGSSSKLKKEVYFNHSWIRMIQDNAVAILGWIQFEKVKWLQNNNPEVPGLVYKLAPMDEKMRKLNAVRKLWDVALSLDTIQDVFTDEPIDPYKYDVDHFIPWSFVMNDELWNLMPMDSSLNSSKSNKLPEWDPFFGKFLNNQFVLYRLIHDSNHPEMHKRFEACYKDNIHSIWANQELYRPGNSIEEFGNILEKNMRPVYDSARRQGYELWKV